jgi:hypothetical protein
MRGTEQQQGAQRSEDGNAEGGCGAERGGRGNGR